MEVANVAFEWIRNDYDRISCSTKVGYYKNTSGKLAERRLPERRGPARVGEEYWN